MDRSVYTLLTTLETNIPLELIQIQSDYIGYSQKYYYDFLHNVCSVYSVLYLTENSSISEKRMNEITDLMEYCEKHINFNEILKFFNFEQNRWENVPCFVDFYKIFPKVYNYCGCADDYFLKFIRKWYGTPPNSTTSCLIL